MNYALRHTSFQGSYPTWFSSGDIVTVIDVKSDGAVTIKGKTGALKPHGNQVGFQSTPPMKMSQVGRDLTVISIKPNDHVELSDNEPTQQKDKRGDMTGNVYEGVVVKTTQVPAGEGLTSAVPKSEIVMTVPAFIAKDDGTALATVMAAAVAKGQTLDDPVNVIEAKIRKYA